MLFYEEFKLFKITNSSSPDVKMTNSPDKKEDLGA